MKYVVCALLITINCFAMEQEKNKKEEVRLPQNHECFLALTRFNAMVRACVTRPVSSSYDANDCVSDYYKEFLKECDTEAKNNRK